MAAHNTASSPKDSRDRPEVVAVDNNTGINHITLKPTDLVDDTNAEAHVQSSVVAIGNVSTGVQSGPGGLEEVQNARKRRFETSTQQHLTDLALPKITTRQEFAEALQLFGRHVLGCKTLDNISDPNGTLDLSGILEAATPDQDMMYAFHETIGESLNVNSHGRYYSEEIGPRKRSKFDYKRNYRPVVPFNAGATVGCRCCGSSLSEEQKDELRELRERVGTDYLYDPKLNEF